AHSEGNPHENPSSPAAPTKAIQPFVSRMCPEWRSRLDSYEPSVDVPRPAVDSSLVVADEEPTALHGLHDVEVVGPAHFAEDDVSNANVFQFHRRHCAELTRFDPSRHRVAPGSKLDAFAATEFLYMARRPAHFSDAAEEHPDTSARRLDCGLPTSPCPESASSGVRRWESAPG